ncbi:MAG: biotin-dependent carboxyltransferase family protein [Candidatus Limnocylindria bacterium]
MIEVLEPGTLTSVQTPYGRPGWRHLGVPVGGAADVWSARLANRLVGNRDDAALIEVTLTGPSLRFETSSTVGVAGSRFDLILNGLPLPMHAARPVRAGSTLRIGQGAGARCYVAVGGGIEVPAVLGSAATDLRSGFGGHEGRALRVGDRLLIGHALDRLRRWSGADAGGDAIRIIAVGREGGAQALSDGSWTVSEMADRTGVRIDGRALLLAGHEVASMGIPIGAIQVPPDGRPIIMLADRPVTGGYPVPACVIGADVGRVAQLRPGDSLRLAAVSADDARQLLREMEVRLAALEDIAASMDDEPGWAGALE